MKKIMAILSLTLVIVTVATAQTATTGAAKPKTATASKLTENDLLMCDKDWHPRRR